MSPELQERARSALAAKQAEKDRYVRLYAQAHISEDELAVYMADLKNQIDNLRLLLSSVEAEISTAACGRIDPPQAGLQVSGFRKVFPDGGR